MEESPPTFGVNLGPSNQFLWVVERAVLCVYQVPGGGLHRAVWQLEAGTRPRFACVFADVIGEQLVYPAEGQALTTALRQLAGFDHAAFADGQLAVDEGTGGRFVCWDRSATNTITPAAGH